jgi:hypothetical protein
MTWLTNVKEDEAADASKRLRRGYVGRRIRIGEPKATSAFGTSALVEMGLVGLYEVAEGRPAVAAGGQHLDDGG